MGKKKGILATIAIPAILLAGGAGIGLVVAKEPAPRESREGRTAASAELTDQLRRAIRAESARTKAASRKGKRQRQVKKMSIATAEKSAEMSARRTWDTDWNGIDWNDYGTGDCSRLSRAAVTCLAWVDWTVNDYADSDYGALYTCEWWVTSRWEKKKSKRGKKVRYRLEVTDGRSRAVCDYA